MLKRDYSAYYSSIPLFAREVLHFTPDPVQSKILTENPKRCILNCTRQWGKSTITAIKALHHAIMSPESLALVISPSERQSREFIKKVADFSTVADLKARGYGKSGIALRFPNGSRIVGLPSKQDTIRGYSSVTLLLIDEASRVSDKLYHAVRPMIAVSEGDLWLISTPAGRRGFFYEAWASNDPEWTRISIPATECPRITKKFLDTERRDHPDYFFRQEYLCEFHDEDDQLLSTEHIERALSPTVRKLNFAPPRPAVVPRPEFTHVCVYGPPPSPPPPDRQLRTKFYLAVDFGKSMDYSAITILEKSLWEVGPIPHWNYTRAQQERFDIVHLERFALNTPYLDVVARIGQLVRSLGPRANVWLSADATGVGNIAIELIRKLGTGCMLYPVIITSGDRETLDVSTYRVPRQHLVSSLVQQFENGIVKISSELDLAKILVQELASLRAKVSKAGNDLLATEKVSQHDDLVLAVALANWQAIKDKWFPPQQRLF